MKRDKIKISCVSYLNSAPFLYGIRNSDLMDDIILSIDHPSECAFKLTTGAVDIGLIPVAAIPAISNAEIISEYCIGANGDVTSVLLLSEYPVNRINNILLDYQSMTSVNLVQILCRELWKINPVYLPTSPGFEDAVNGDTAAVIIGDRALERKDDFEFVYDLSGGWKALTGLPFVFAAWVGNRKLPDDFTGRFNRALRSGIENIDLVINELKQENRYFDGLETYFGQHLDYNLNEEARKGLDLFLEKMNENSGNNAIREQALQR